MFCPKCATKNMEGASFCRTCGANISLVPQALSGQPVPYEEIDDSRAGRKARRRQRKEEPRLDNAFRNIFMGVAFLVVAIALARSGQSWWFWMLFPSFSMMATGVSQYIRVKDQERKAAILRGHNIQALPNRESYVPSQNLSAPGTGELRPPVPSVTEGTTRHLGVEAPTRHFDSDPK
ncbi:MAG TPA: zinc ribbon domain-containing protein [Pyrinomonadaceae bacterium]